MNLFTLLFIINSLSNSSPISIRIPEELTLSTVIFTVTNSTSNYRLFDSGRNQNSFVFYNSSTGNLHLSRSIDREQLCSEHICSCDYCRLTVELIEWQTPYHLIQLEFEIDDLNDNSPFFSSKNFSIRLVENSPIGNEFVLENAKDVDEGENSRLTYRLETIDGKSVETPFELIEKLSGSIALKINADLDREERNFYQIRLIASDHGEPSRSNSTILNIEIEDLNDNAVEIERSFIQLNLSESTPIGTILTEIKAKDDDIGLNGKVKFDDDDDEKTSSFRFVFSKIFYSITNGFPMSSWIEHFRLGESTGILTLIQPFDYEIEHFYQLTVQIRDAGENSVSKFVTIEISVFDENDNDPQAFVTFLQPFSSSSILILENTPIGQILAHVSVSDDDDGPNGRISLEIQRGDDLIGLKYLDQRSFLLIVNRLIDREEEEQNSTSNRFVLNIFDHGVPQRSIQLEFPIEIGDVNDNSPIFDEQSENCHRSIDFDSFSSDRPVMEVRAIDADKGENGRVTYSIVQFDDQRLSINDQGEIFLINGFNQTENYSFEIIAQDHGDEFQQNSSILCSISSRTFSTENSSSSIDHFSFDSIVFLIGFIFIILLFLLILTFSLRHCFDENKTYHLYVTVPKHEHDEHFSSPSPNFFPSIDHRPVSLSISTTTTSTSFDIESKSNRTLTHIVQLAEEENSEI